MRDILVEAIRTRLATAALILLHIAVAVFVVISAIHSFQAIAGASRQIANLHDPMLAGALAAAFVPFGCIVFWGYKALAAQLHDVFGTLQQNKDHRK